MTLIELLVVVGILGLLSVLVLPSLSGNGENRLGRAAAEQVTALMNQARNAAMASGRPLGVMIQPIASNSAAAIDLYRCRIPPPYRGDSTPANVTFSLASKRVAVAAGTPGCLNAIEAALVAQSDLVTFDDRGPVYKIASEPDATGFAIALRATAAGQSEVNTPWPPENVAMTFAIDRRPRVVGAPTSLDKGRCVDLKWSGFTGTSGFVSFNAGRPVAITFDTRGQILEVLNNGVRETVTGPVFFLIGRADRAGAPYAAAAGTSVSDDSEGANWQYPSSYWIAIDPASGQVRTAECKPNVGNSPDLSRAWVSAGLGSQGL